MSDYRFETLQLHVGQEQPDPATDSRAVPIYQTTSYVFKNSQHAADRFGLADAGNIYGRLTNSTQDVFEKRIAALEGGSAALAVASGAAAITYTIQALAANGGHIVAQKTIYGGSYNLLAHTLTQYGITTTFVDAHNLDEVKAAIQDNTRAIYLETLGNPNSDIPNIDAIAEIAHEAGLPVVVDNTFGTPYLFRPFEHGADVVVHSATKFIGGHGTTLGGIIIEWRNCSTCITKKDCSYKCYECCWSYRIVEAYTMVAWVRSCDVIVLATCLPVKLSRLNDDSTKCCSVSTDELCC